MRSSYVLSALVSSAFINPSAALAESAPETADVLVDRDVWTRCTPGSDNICTIYMATGLPGFVTIEPYRNFALFDKDCKLTSVFATDKDDRHIRIKGHLPEYVELEVNDATRPKGTIRYKGRSWDLGDELECHGSDDVDGIGCRRHFIC